MTGIAHKKIETIAETGVEKCIIVDSPKFPSSYKQINHVAGIATFQKHILKVCGKCTI